MYSLWGPTTIAFMDTHFGLTAAVTAELYAGAYGDSVVANTGAFSEVVSSAVDDTLPMVEGPLHQVLNSVGLDPNNGHNSESVWASDAEAEIIKTLGKSMGMDTDMLIWYPEDAGGRARMTGFASIIAQMPYGNEIFPMYARTALSPYGLENDEKAVKSVMYAMTKTLGLGQVFFNPKDTIDRERRDIKRDLGRLVPPGAKAQYQGHITMPEVDSEEGPR
jgi:hypothetical protein